MYLFVESWRWVARLLVGRTCTELFLMTTKGLIQIARVPGTH